MNEIALYLVQCSPFITLCLGSLEINCVISKSCYKGTILQRNYRKMTVIWSFSYNSFVKFHGKKIGSHYMARFFLNPCNNEVCYKGSLPCMYVIFQSKT